MKFVLPIAALILLLLSLLVMFNQYRHNTGDKHHIRRGYKSMMLLFLGIVSLEAGVHLTGIKMILDPLSGWIHLPIAVVTFLWLALIGFTGRRAAKFEVEGSLVSYLHYILTLYRLPLYALLVSIVTGIVFFLRSYSWEGN